MDDPTQRDPRVADGLALAHNIWTGLSGQVPSVKRLRALADKAEQCARVLRFLANDFESGASVRRVE